MDLILATAHADVEVSVDALHDSVTLLDLLAVLAPAPAPKVIYVEGRALPAGTLVSASGLVNGSVLSLSAPPASPIGPSVSLVQAAGEGAGSRCPLRPGRYSVGPARRANVSALAASEVLQPQFELTVEHDLGVVVTAVEGTLDGRRVAEATAWREQHLRIGNRVFRLEPAVDDAAVLVERSATGQLELGPARIRPTTVAPGNDGGRPWPARRGRSPIGVAPGAEAADVSPPPAALARRRHPDVAEVVRRAMVRSSRLWQRTPADPDAFRFSVGLADQLPPGATEVGQVVWPTVPAVVDLATERGVAIVSPALHARAAARALVLQACVVHRPDDLDVVVLADASGASRWEWVKWLPHARSSQGVQLLSDHESIADWLNAQRTLSAVVAAGQALDRVIPPTRVTLVVIDDPALWRGRAALLRGVFAETNLPLRFLALTDDIDDVPAVCSTVVTILKSGAARVESSTAGTDIAGVVPFVLDYDVAVTAARRLSPVVDRSAQRTVRAALPAQVSLASLIDVEGLDAGRMAERWQAAARSRRLQFPIGVGLAGTVELDLVDDGPSALIVGSPRSGKTDALRNLLASVLLTAGPQAVSVVTVEATPRSTFDELANMPHIAGRIEQFNDRRGSRLLRSLRAEASARARTLRNLQVDSISEYNATVDVDPMPRLVIAVDDADIIGGRSATFLPQLVEIVEAAKHLGLHLLLSSGQFSASFQASVRTLSGARIALRMHDPAEAAELVGTREPVHLSSHAPGRAVIATRTAAARAMQIASASAPSSGLLDMVPFVVARGMNATERRLAAVAAGDALAPGRTGTLRSVREVIEATQRIVASEQAEGYTTRTVLSAELPGLVPYEDLRERNTGRVDAVAIGLADLPDEQRIDCHWWRPAFDGNIALIGGTAAERAEIIATYAVAAGEHFSAARVLTYLVDASSQQVSEHVPLEAVERLRNCAGAVSIDDPDRVLRLLGYLDAEVDRRAAVHDGTHGPTIVLLINDVAALLRHFESGGDMELGGKMLSRIIEVGPRHGMSTVVSAAGESGVPPEILAEFPGRALLSLDDRAEYRSFAVEPARIPSSVAGRAITLPEQIEIQLASLGGLEPAIQAVLDLGGKAAAGADGSDVPRAARIAPTPESIGFADVIGAAGHDDHGWLLPIGLHAHTLQPLAMPLSRGDAALIVGEAGTGKAAVLEVVARAVLQTRGEALVHAIAAARRPYFELAGLTSAGTGADIGAVVDEVLRHPSHEQIVIVDDAGLPDDVALRRLAQAAGGAISIIVAGRARRLDEPDHWSAPLRRFRTGVLLRPLAGDGSVFGLQVSTSASQTLPNRGLLVHHGTTTPVLLANQRAAHEVGT